MDRLLINSETKEAALRSGHITMQTPSGAGFGMQVGHAGATRHNSQGGRTCVTFPAWQAAQDTF